MFPFTLNSIYYVKYLCFYLFILTFLGIINLNAKMFYLFTKSFTCKAFFVNLQDSRK